MELTASVHQYVGWNATKDIKLLETPTLLVMGQGNGTKNKARALVRTSILFYFMFCFLISLL